MDIEVDRRHLPRTRVVERAPDPLDDGQARVRIDRFGFSSNNVTYAVVGDLLRYWEFFPAAAPDPGDDTSWGRIPVWGFGAVTETRSPDLGPGERLFGYFPMSTELVLVPGHAQERTVTDLAPHRAEKAGAYNSYQRCAADPLYRADREELQMLLYPLFFTSFVIDDFLADNSEFGADQVVISSASAKTSIGEAFLAHARGQRAVGLTSAGNLAFTRSLGVYDQVERYEEVASVARVPSVYIDVSGDQDVLRDVHTHLDGVLAHSMIVGDTHWDHTAAPAEGQPPGPRPRFLFAPDQIAKRTREWGSGELNARVAAAWDGFTEWVPTWLRLRAVSGPAAVTDLYRSFLSGSVDPRLGFTCALAGG